MAQVVIRRTVVEPRVKRTDLIGETTIEQVLRERKVGAFREVRGEAVEDRAGVQIRE